VIVPVYKTEKYLHHCVDSILTQSFSDLELILVDDGSPDACGAICDEYAAKDSRVRVIHQENGGLSAARNAGLDVASGQYVGFVDGDDYIHKDMYRTLFVRLTADGSDMACCNYVSVDEAGEVRPAEQSLPLDDACVSVQEAVGCLIRYGGYYGIACNKLYDRRIFQTLRYPAGKKYEDTFVIHRILEKCHTISHVKAPLYYYVRRIGSLTLSDFSIKDLDYAEAMLDQYAFAKEQHWPDLQRYAASRLSYKFSEWAKRSDSDPLIAERLHKLKTKCRFLLYSKGAWEYENRKGRCFERLCFLFPFLRKKTAAD
jgi:glycosyltransferase involved in cell wall biosynthesis